VVQKLQVVLTCDLHDGAVEGVETVTFGYDGVAYAFELCQEHLDDFRASMGQWVAAARRTDELAAHIRSGPAPSAADTGAIRVWARQAGYEVSERGRIPSHVRAAYQAAHEG
jgi:hypothetical protein